MRLALNRVREPTAQALMLLDIYSALILQTSMYLVARRLPYTRVYISSYRRAQDGRARQTAQAHSRYKRTCFTGTKVHILTQAAPEEHRATHNPLFFRLFFFNWYKSANTDASGSRGTSSHTHPRHHRLQDL
jgi:hypothetical protein